MSNGSSEKLELLAASGRRGERLRAMDMISRKTGGGVARTISDPRVIPLLMRGLVDVDRRVQRAAARGLRPWIDEDPNLLEAVLRAYASDSFDGRYSHAGLYDTRSSTIWIPRYAAVSGHAALLPHGNADRYFRFDFFVPGQAPGWIPESRASGQLIMYLVPEWGYSRQRLIHEHEDRLVRANVREQQRYAGDVVSSYRRALLGYEVRVDLVTGGGGHHRSRELDVERLAPAACPT